MTVHRERGGRRRGWRLGAVAVAVLLAAGGLTAANAATLSVSGGSVSTATAGPCTTQRIDLAREWLIVYYAVRLSNLPVSCQGKPIVVSASNNTITGTSAGATSSSVQIATTYSWTAPTFTVLIDGWVVPTNQ